MIHPSANSCCCPPVSWLAAHLFPPTTHLGLSLQNLPDDWQCPVCGAEKRLFQSRAKELAGFAENQGYGLGTNSMTSEQKSLLIYGSLAFFIVLFLLGYTLE